MSLFRYLTLERIGATLFGLGILLLVSGGVGLVLQELSGGRVRFVVAGFSGGPVILFGLTGLVFSAMILSLAIIQERLVRMEAKLNKILKSQGVEEPPMNTPS